MANIRALRWRLSCAANYRLRDMNHGRYASRCRPTSITFLLTELCNARCTHCDIWKNKGKEDAPTQEQWKQVLTDLRHWLGLAQVTMISAPAIFENGLKGAYAFYSLVQEIQPSQVLLSFVPVLSLLPWAGQLGGADNIFFTDQCSRREEEIVKPALGFRKFLGRFLTKPYKQVFCSSNYVRRENVRRGYVAAEGLITLHNSVDFGRTAATHKGAEVRRRLGIRPEKIVISQVSWLRPE